MRRNIFLPLAALTGGLSICLLLKASEFTVSILPEWISYSLPGSIWAFGCALLISTIWSDSKAHLRFIWLAIAPVFVLGNEFAQLLKWFPGCNHIFPLPY